MSPKSANFDYRKLFKDDVDHSELDKYFDSELMNFIDNITSSDRMVSKNKPSSAHTFSRKLKCMMICSIHTGKHHGPQSLLYANFIRPCMLCSRSS